MTDKKLKELLIVIDNRYGRVRSKEDRIIDLKTCVQAFGMVPDEIVEKALYAAFAKCRFPNQIIVDWCAGNPQVAELPVQPYSKRPVDAGGIVAARKIERQTSTTCHPRRAGDGHREADRRGLPGQRIASIFGALPAAVRAMGWLPGGAGG